MENEYANPRTYSKEISRVFGFLSIPFSIVMPPTGIMMGIIGFVYERKNSKEHGSLSKINLLLNFIGIVVGAYFIWHFLQLYKII